jgi:hypothetical protein
MHSLAKRTLVAVGIAVVGMQFVPTAAKQHFAPSMQTHLGRVMNPEVGAILERSCQDCHSANTRWPWYSRVAPISWIVARDVDRGRAKLDFTDWAVHRHSENERMEICDAVSNGSMPMRAYTVVHRDARLSMHDVDRICDWAGSPDTPPTPKPGGSKVTAASLASIKNFREGIR